MVSSRSKNPRFWSTYQVFFPETVELSKESESSADEEDVPKERELILPEIKVTDEPLVSPTLLPPDILFPRKRDLEELPASIYGGIKIRASSTALELGIGIAYLVNNYAVLSCSSTITLESLTYKKTGRNFR